MASPPSSALAALASSLASTSSASSSSSSSSSLSSESDCPKGKLTRQSKPVALRTPKSEAPWQKMLDDNLRKLNSIDKEETRDGMYFRRRFRIPFPLYTELVTCMIDEGWFHGFGPQGQGQLDATKREEMRGASLWVKVLSVLRILGRGLVFDECFDGSGCSESMIGQFFHEFLGIFVSRLLHCVVCPPKTLQELNVHLRIYERLGMNGAFGSTDVTHIPLGKCPRSYAIMCTGKSGKPTLGYSMTCSHARRIYHCSHGFAGSKNDKTISKFEALLEAVSSEPLYTEATWTCFQADGQVLNRKGVYLICDGGYHKWYHMICGLKNTASLAHTLWSCQMESVRKDVECLYGILKMRFAILTRPLQYHSKTAPEYLRKMNNIVWSCCILHNLLLGYDRLDSLWTEHDVLSTWYADADAEFDSRFDLGAAAHQAIIEKRTNSRQRLFRKSTLGKVRPRRNAIMVDARNFVHDELVVLEGEPEDETQYHPSHTVRREELVESFHYAWNAGSVEWLSFPGTVHSSKLRNCN